MATQNRLPTGNGTPLEWSPGSTYEQWEACDDPIGSPDGDSTYIWESTSGQTTLFTFSAFNFAASSVTSLAVALTARTDGGATPQEVKAVIKVGGVLYEASAGTVSTAYETVTLVWLLNPATGLAWTVNDILGTGGNPLQEFGCRAGTLSMGHIVRVTQAYAAATYSEETLGQPMMLRATTVPHLRPWHPRFNR